MYACIFFDPKSFSQHESANGDYPEMENALEKWLNNLRDRGACVSSFMIKVEAMRILRAVAEKNKTECIFKALNGWFYNFISRKKFTLRIITTSGTIIKIFSYFYNCQV